MGNLAEELRLCLEKEQRETKRLRTKGSELKALLEASRMANGRDEDGLGCPDLMELERRRSAVSSRSGVSYASSAVSGSTLGDELRDADSEEDVLETHSA